MSYATDTATFVIGNNMPGYMPDSDPFTVEGTFDEAKRALISELLFAAEYAATEEEAEDLTHAAEYVNLWRRPDTIRVGNYVYWLTEG